MERGTGRIGMMIILLLVGVLVSVVNVQPVRASETIYIRADGSIDPPTAPIQRNGNLYTLIGNFTGIGSTGIIIERNNMTLDGAGYTLQGVGWGKGIKLTGRSNVTIQNIKMTMLDKGVDLDSSSNNRVIGNSITTEVHGIVLFSYCLNNVVSGNNITSAISGVFVAMSSSNNSISGNNIRSNSNGIYISGLSGEFTSIIGNNITNNGNGIYLYHSSNNTVSKNRITNNSLGIYLYHSSNNSISENNITSNDQQGISLSGSSNVVSGNNIIDNGAGIELVDSSNSYISGNNITNNELGIGIYFTFALNNKIWHNNFVNNIQQTPGGDPPNPCPNMWDDGYPSGGNYWSDYTGIDLKKGENQDLGGSDGFGDTPYKICLGLSNQDRYPLMNPCSQVRDVAITSIVPSKCIVGQGYSLSINVTAANQYDYIETFTVMVYANTTTISETIVTLPWIGGSSRTLTFNWNTTGFAKGNYTMSAYATPVPGETNVADNTYVKGIVTVTIPGDVDGDFDVDIIDVVKITSRYGEVLQPIWPKPSIDIDSDGKITILDVVICTSHYGEKDP